MSSNHAKNTVSERLFEELCARTHIAWSRVSEEDGRRPDYVVTLAGHRVVVEVKQFDANDTEAKTLASLAATGTADAFSTKPGDRIRKAIGSAAPQLRALSNGERPAMLVVYNNVLSSRLHTDPYAVATAMDGFDVVPVIVPQDRSLSPEFQNPRSGPGKKMTDSAHTTISAIGVLFTVTHTPHLDVFHNRHARHPIAPGWFRSECVRHFRRPSHATSSLVAWDET